MKHISIPAEALDAIREIRKQYPTMSIVDCINFLKIEEIEL